MKNLLLVLFINSPFLLVAQVIQDSKEDEEKIFTKIEIEAGFKGGTVKWNEFVRKNFNFTRIEKSLPDSVVTFSDTAKIQFVVDKNGIIKDIKILSRTLPAFQQSCIEVYKNSPHWNPANQCGRSVNAYRKETFILQIDKSTNKRVILVRS
jgi:periplasmic protein TonB